MFPIFSHGFPRVFPWFFHRTLGDLGLHVVGPRRGHVAGVVPEALRGAAEAHVLRCGDPMAERWAVLGR